MRDVTPRHLLAVLLASTAIGWAVAAQPTPTAVSRPVVVASKPFGESYFLAELFAQLLEHEGRTVTRRPGLGATEVAFTALRSGAIDVYPEYVGTGLVALLGDSVTPAMRSDPRLAYAHVVTKTRDRFGAHWLAPLGFQNGYAIAVRREVADRLQLRTLSDLAARGSALRAGFTSDFIGRADGWPALQRVYRMQLVEVRPLAPAIKYDALVRGAVDVIDGYATDGLLAKYDLAVLEDDRQVFPPYDAAPLASADFVRDDPAAVGILSHLAGRLTEAQLRRWNRLQEVDGVPVRDVARAALRELRLIPDTAHGSRTASTGEPPQRAAISTSGEIGRHMLEHLRLLTLALLLAIVTAVPLALALSRTPRLSAVITQVLGILQTVPSLALLAFMIPLVGIGTTPALLALWAYALLPIARATITGIRLADRDVVAAVEALGATTRQSLFWVRLPLAAPVMMSGIRTAAVLTVGTATLAAFIGAGGLGEPIVTGLALADTRLVLSGAIPAAVLAIVIDLLLASAERLVTPPHLRASATASGVDTSRLSS